MMGEVEPGDGAPPFCTNTSRGGAMKRPESIGLTRRSVLGGATSLALMGGSMAAATNTQQPGRGGTMTVLYFVELPLVPLTTTGTYSSAKITEGLFWYDHDMVPQPQLATDYQISDDRLVYTFDLRRGVKWHDGKDFTADDAVFSLLTLKRVNPRGRSTFAAVESVEALTPYRIALRLRTPIPYLMQALMATETPMVPKHIYEGTDLATNPNNTAPVGTGPFRFKERVPGSYVVLEKNENYWDPGKPYLDRIIIKYVPDAGGRSVALESGDADLTGRSSVALNDIARLRKLLQLNFEPKGYESNQNVSMIYFNLDSPFFRDLKVRQAVAHAVDREAIARIIYFGQMIPCSSPIGPALRDFHDPSPSPYPFDVKRAEVLLDEAGYKRGTDGTRFKIVFDQSPIMEERTRFAEYVRAALSRVGISVEVRMQDAAGYLKRIYTDREFDITCGSASNLFDPTVGVQRLYWSKNFIRGVPFSNCSNYSNARVDDLLEAAAIEADVAKRKALFREFQQLVMQEVPTIPFGAHIWYTIHNRRVQGHSTTAEGVEANMAEAYVAS